MENRKEQSNEKTEDKTEFGNSINKSSNSKYKILKVDSISDAYIIYALKSEKYYKIISKKSDLINTKWERIELEEFYSLKLKTEYSQTGMYEHVSGIAKEDGPIIYFEGDSITDLYSSPNIKGLYYKPENEKH